MEEKKESVVKAMPAEMSDEEKEKVNITGDESKYVVSEAELEHDSVTIRTGEEVAKLDPQPVEAIKEVSKEEERAEI